VDDARALREQVQTRPAFCRYRVYIIDEVHMMSRAAFDALLKILEEPPAHAVFVLATTELQDVPDTIKSRVQIFPFRLIPVPVIEGRLRHVCEQEGVTWDEGSLRLLAEAGQGSMRDALTTLDRVISAGAGRVEEDLVREQLGIVPAVTVQATLEALLQGDTPGILDQCAVLASLGTDWTSFWRELMLAFRARMEADLRRGAPPHETLRWARMLQLLLQRERDLRDTSLPDVVVELALVTAAQLPHLAPLDALLKAGGAAAAPPAPVRPAQPQPADRPAQIQAADRPAQMQPAARPAAVAEPRAPQLAPVQPPADLEQLRRACAEALKQAPGGLPRTLGALPHMALDLSFQGDTLRWLFPPDVRNTVQDLEKEQANPHLLEALRRVLPGLARLAITFAPDSKARPEEALRADPALQRLLADTGGEIVEIRRGE
jgi:DNA polymerase-3 subunit gamma/tau